MTVPFMRAYTELLVRTCHRRGAHAIGGMAAFIPSRDPAANERALAQVRGRQGARGRRRLRRLLGGPPGPGRRLPRGVRPAARRPAAPDRPAPRRRHGHRGRPARRRPAPAARSPRRACAPTSPWRCATSRPGCGGTGAVAHLRPDGGRGDRRDRPLPGLAVAAPRHPARRRPRRSTATWSTSCWPRSTPPPRRNRTAPGPTSRGRATCSSRPRCRPALPEFFTVPGLRRAPHRLTTGSPIMAPPSPAVRTRPGRARRRRSTCVPEGEDLPGGQFEHGGEERRRAHHRVDLAAHEPLGRVGRVARVVGEQHGRGPAGAVVPADERHPRRRGSRSGRPRPSRPACARPRR